MNKGLHIGAHVWTSHGWGFIRTSPTGDLYTVHMDDGSVQTFFSADIIPETFWQFLTKRPGRVGAWRLIDFAVVQGGLACIMIGGAWTFLDLGWVALSAGALVEAVIYYGMRANWRGKAA